jgi:hypothetical protein
MPRGLREITCLSIVGQSLRVQPGSRRRRSPLCQWTSPFFGGNRRKAETRLSRLREIQIDVRIAKARSRDYGADPKHPYRLIVRPGSVHKDSLMELNGSVT